MANDTIMIVEEGLLPKGIYHTKVSTINQIRNLKDLIDEYCEDNKYTVGDWVLRINQQYDCRIFTCISDTTGEFDEKCWEERFLSNIRW